MYIILDLRIICSLYCSYALIFVILSDTKKNYLRIERPDPTIYNYTYPCWFLSKANFLNSLKDYYKITLNKTEEPYSLNDGENYYNLKLIKKR